MEDAIRKIAEAEEKANQKYQEALLCINEQELANFSWNDGKVLSSECRTRLAKTGSLDELIGEGPDGLKYRTELVQTPSHKQQSKKR